MRSAGGPRVIVMGVSAVGKSTVGAALARQLGVPFLDGDDLHSASAIAKMSAGKPLDDRDRMPWLRECGRALAAQDHGAVIACSALARRYRDVLVAEAPDAVFVHLHAGFEQIAAHARDRDDHFMPVSLLASQYATLEPLLADERGMVADANAEVSSIVERVLRFLS